jgi:hypothetical protein
VLDVDELGFPLGDRRLYVTTINSFENSFNDVVTSGQVKWKCLRCVYTSPQLKFPAEQ